MYLVSCSLGVSMTMYLGKAQPRLLARLAYRKVNRLRVVGRGEAGELAELKRFLISTEIECRAWWMLSKHSGLSCVRTLFFTFYFDRVLLCYPGWP